ncbi:acetyl-CoA carboxylase biotin carboxyl carrier protein [Aquisphaera insulae]|uniref:acetyl-CoA carboxylase biotin carboxyl carrier protein n=1 Tax=Aquisphaera insulae TaxID=2712864 RepID=UPI00202F23AA|nr:acetyl-CoA carboxylase biotin carboxyl carrier protein [Aquisphaera insulae]
MDVQKIHYLVRLMKRYDITALSIHDGPLQVRLRRRGHEAPPAAHAQHLPAAVAYPPAYAPAPPQAPPPPAATSAPAPAAPAGILIKSPMVGTYYASSAPDTPAFVNVGSAIHPESTVCIIEAMKVFTDIPAGVSGTIAEILVKNGQAVEYDQPLFRVNPA